MSHTEPDQPAGHTPEADRVRTDIEATRSELADTVDALGDKLNVKAQAADRFAETKDKLAPHRSKILIGVAVTAVVLIVVRRRGRKADR